MSSDNKLQLPRFSLRQLRGNRPDAAYRVTLVKNENAVEDLITPVSKTRLRLRSVKRNFVRAVTVFLLTVLAVGALATPANAQDNPLDFKGAFEDMFCSVAVDPAKITSPANLPPSAKNLDPAKDKYTAYEKYGTGGLVFTTWIGPQQQQHMDGDGTNAGRQLVTMAGGKDSGIQSWGDSDDKNDSPSTAQKGFFDTDPGCLPMLDIFNSAFGTTLMDGAAGITFLGNLFYEMALNSGEYFELLFGPGVTAVVTALRGSFWAQLIGVVIVLSALTLGWVGLVKRQSTVAAQGFGWMIFAMVAGANLMLNPFWISNTASTFTTEVGTLLTSQVAKETSKVMGEKNNLCQTNEVPAVSSENQLREFQCSTWYTFNYSMWVQGQFGDSNGGETGHGINNIGYELQSQDQVQLGNTAASEQSWALTHLDSRVAYKGANESKQDKDFLHTAAAQEYKSDYNRDWKGDNSSNRVTVGWLALIGSLAFLLIVMSPAYAILKDNVNVLILIILSPIFLTVGVHPGMGRKIALRWLQSMLGLHLRILINVAYMSVFTMLLTMAANSSADNLTKILCSVVLAFASLSYRGTVEDMFAGHLNFISGKSDITGLDAPWKLGKDAANFMSDGARKTFRQMRGDSRNHRENQSHSTSNQSETRELPRTKEDHTENQDSGSDTKNGGKAPFDPTTDGAGARPSEEHEEPAKTPAESPAQAQQSGAGERPRAASDDAKRDESSASPVKDAPKVANPSAGARPQRSSKGSTPVPPSVKQPENIRSDAESRRERRDSGSLPPLNPTNEKSEAVRPPRDPVQPKREPVQPKREGSLPNLPPKKESDKGAGGRPA